MADILSASASHPQLIPKRCDIQEPKREGKRKVPGNWNNLPIDVEKKKNRSGFLGVESAGVDRIRGKW